MNFLHLLSSEAVQHVIIHCLNTSVWGSAEDQPVAQASVRFKAWSGEVFEVGGELEPEVIEDSCTVRMRSVIDCGAFHFVSLLTFRLSRHTKLHYNFAMD